MYRINKREQKNMMSVVQWILSIC